MKKFCGQLAVAFLVAATLSSTSAQVHNPPAPKPPPAPKHAASGNPNKPIQNKAGPKPGPAPGQHPLDYWQGLSASQREAQLAKLPPERAANIQRRLENWNKMTPEQKQVARSMTPEKRKIASDHRAWLVEQPPERQKAIVHQTQMLRQMSPEARQAEMESSTFRNRFDATEREHIKKIVSIIPEAGSSIE